MNRVNNYLMKPILGLIGKTGADITAVSQSTMNLPFLLHNFSRGNAVTRRTAGYMRPSPIRYHKSRAMGGF